MIGGGCVLRACTLPVPSPNWDFPNHEGYYLSTGSVYAISYTITS